jgi:protein-tyrosine-phosphatase
MAAGELRRALGADAERIAVESAGTAAWEGQPATEPSQQVAAASGWICPRTVRAAVTPAMVRAADVVLVMERAHLAAVCGLGADPERAHVLSEWPAPGEPGWKSATRTEHPARPTRSAGDASGITSRGCCPPFEKCPARARPERLTSRFFREVDDGPGQGENNLDEREAGTVGRR